MIAKVTKKQLALLHVAKNRLDLNDAYYREILAQFKKPDGQHITTGKDLNRVQFNQLMNIFERMGFRSVSSNQYPVSRNQQANGKPKNPMTDKQMQKIWLVWNQVSTAKKDAREKALNSFVWKKVEISHWRWLTVAKAQKIITILEAMRRQAKQER